MRAIFLHDGTRWTGTARAFTVAARGLAARGWDVAIACAADSAVRREAERTGIPIVAMDAKRSLMGDAERLRRALKDRPVDAIYVHSEREQIAAATAAWRAKSGVVVRRACAGVPLVWGRGARTALRLAPTAVLATWEEQADLPPEVGPLPSVPEPNGWRGERRLVCVCDPGARARTAIVLRAVAMLAPRHRELTVTFVGPGAADEELRLHAAALGIHRLVRHATDRHADAAARAAAHVGWTTADGDDGAFGALDFMAAGVPVLAERGSVASRYVADAITGVHLTPGDVPSTAASLAALLARDDERTAMGNAGRARLMRTFGEAAMLDGFARAASAAVGRARVRR